MGLFSGSGEATATASGSGGGSGGGGGFGGIISGFLQAHPEILSSQKTGGATSEESPGNATNKRNGGAIHSASSRADGIAQRGKTRGKIY